MVIQCNPFVANPPIFEIVGDPSPNPPLVDAPGCCCYCYYYHHHHHHHHY